MLEIRIGQTARAIRDHLGFTQERMAEELGISVVHLSNIENNKSAPSRRIVDRYRELTGIDPYVLAWCLHVDVERLPQAIRSAARKLADAMECELTVLTEANSHRP